MGREGCLRAVSACGVVVGGALVIHSVLPLYPQPSTLSLPRLLHAGIATARALSTQLTLCFLLALCCRTHLRALSSFIAPYPASTGISIGVEIARPVAFPSTAVPMAKVRVYSVLRHALLSVIDSSPHRRFQQQGWFLTQGARRDERRGLSCKRPLDRVHNPAVEAEGDSADGVSEVGPTTARSGEEGGEEGGTKGSKEGAGDKEGPLGTRAGGRRHNTHTHTHTHTHTETTPTSTHIHTHTYTYTHTHIRKLSTRLCDCADGWLAATFGVRQEVLQVARDVALWHSQKAALLLMLLPAVSVQKVFRGGWLLLFLLLTAAPPRTTRRLWYICQWYTAFLALLSASWLSFASDDLSSGWHTFLGLRGASGTAHSNHIAIT